jgi:UDP-N-acetylmuramate--alanine ligase
MSDPHAIIRRFMTPRVPTHAERPPDAAATTAPQAVGGDGERHLNGVRSAYLLGVGGVGMSGAAELLLARGIAVAGSDGGAGERTPRLEGLGVTVDRREDADLLPGDVDLVVASAAIPPGHAQLREARRRGLEVWKYADLLGALMADRKAICVAGSHGKTTTTALIASALAHAGRDPAYVVGGDLREFGAGAGCGAGPEFVAESCEFDRSFHRHRPRIGVVLNIDADHLDYYSDLAEIQEAFRVFAALLPADGVLLVNDAYAPLFKGDDRIRARIETFGFGDDAHWRTGEPRTEGPAHVTSFALARQGQPLGRIATPLLGRHNALNATAAVAALSAAGLSHEEIARGLEAFRGVGRRLELVADRGGILLFDDYGHHPAEIRAVIRALRKKYEQRRVVVVFQPHQASRTRCFMKDFAAALADADEVWMPPIYFARDSEAEQRMVTSEDLAAHVRNEGGVATTLPDLGAVVDFAAGRMRPGDVIVTMGAGNVDEVAHGLAQRIH